MTIARAPLIGAERSHLAGNVGLLEDGIVRCMRRMACILLLSVTGACASAQPAVEPTKITSFAAYRRDTLDLLRMQRRAVADDPEAEILWNAPREWRPATARQQLKPEKGILLVHGLGDSPWSFNDVAEELASRGFLVRTVLLPGHGTHPRDMLEVDLAQWRDVVREQATALQRDVGKVYLGGFSTGANLVTEYAYTNPDIAGLVLFSPAFKSHTGLDWMAPLLSGVRPWLINPDGLPLRNEVRYFMVPTNGFAQFYRSSVAVRRVLERRPYDKPVFMVAVQNDSVLDADYMIKTFQERFPHPASRLIWYGELPARPTDAGRVHVRTDRLPEERISQFSHMGILFDPNNPLYGRRGSIRICWNGQTEEAMKGWRPWAWCRSGRREAAIVDLRVGFGFRS